MKGLGKNIYCVSNSGTFKKNVNGVYAVKAKAAIRQIRPPADPELV